jgi:hypothetical protein
MTSAPTPADGNDRGGDRHDVRSRTRHVNRSRSGQDSPRGNRSHRDAGSRHRGAATQDGDRHDDRDGDRHDDRHDDVRDQIRRLRAQGGTYRSITAAGLAPATVHDLTTGRRARTDAGGTRLRLRALHVMGHSSARIARALGVRNKTIRALVAGDAATVSTALRDAVTDLYDAWWDKRAPERTRAERGAATAARRRAIAGNWCAGAGLDDDHLDTPGYKSAARWKPTAGTGTAPDIQPPDRPRTNPGNPSRRQP